MNDELVARKRISRAVAWVGFASSAVALLDVIALGLLLALWVTPADLGVATLAITLFYFLDLATEAGMTSVLVQQPALDDDTISSVFWLNVMVSTLLFGLLWVVGPLLGRLQGHPVVGTMLIAYGSKLLYQNVYFVPAALLRRELRFKELSIVRTIANLGDVAGRIGFAAAGEPVWCFVAGPLIRIAITGIGLQLCHPWRPRFVLRTERVRAWLVYAGKTTASQALQHFYNNVSYQIVGFYFGDAAVGTYRVAYELVLYPVNFVSNIVAQVAFPAFARMSAVRDQLAAQFRRFSRQNLAMTLPILVVIVVGANDLLAVFFPRVHDGEVVARILCVVGMLRAVDCLYLPLLDGLGLAGRNLIVAIVAALVLAGCDVAASELLGPSLGFRAVAIGRVVGYPLVIALHAWFALGQLGLPARTYVRDLVGILACGIIAIGPGLAIELLAPGLAPAIRLPIVAVVSIVGVALALDRFQGLGIGAIRRELRTS
ncbi:MAG: oligosaccharide flippase family protein [Proteobacteria bacterium]|nr:oligosaccharide flippase family protein [Pseudomonadota bacterium]